MDRVAIVVRHWDGFGFWQKMCIQNKLEESFNQILDELHPSPHSGKALDARMYIKCIKAAFPLCIMHTMHYAYYAFCTLCIMHILCTLCIMHIKHYALCTLCIMHIMHYALCTLCIMHNMHYAHYALCTVCIMHIMHYAKLWIINIINYANYA